MQTFENRELTKGLVSVIVPSYNHSQYIRQCIKSIADQTYKNIELIVIDDGSTDKSVEILMGMRDEFSFELHTQKNIGLPATLNKAIKEYVHGEFVSICASDDYWHPEKASKLVSFLNKNSDIPMCYCKTLFVDENSVANNSVTTKANKHFSGGSIFGELITQQFHFLPGMVRTSLYAELGLYDEDIWTEDFDFNLRTSSRYEIGYIDEYLNYYRYPSGFSQKLTTTRVANAHRQCIDKYRESKYYREALSKWHFRNFVWYSGVAAQKIFALNSMINAARYFYKPAFVKAAARLLLKWR